MFISLPEFVYGLVVTHCSILLHTVANSEKKSSISVRKSNHATTAQEDQITGFNGSGETLGWQKFQNLGENLRKMSISSASANFCKSFS